MLSLYMRSQRTVYVAAEQLSYIQLCRESMCEQRFECIPVDLGVDLNWQLIVIISTKSVQ